MCAGSTWEYYKTSARLDVNKIKYLCTKIEKLEGSECELWEDLAIAAAALRSHLECLDAVNSIV